MLLRAVVGSGATREVVPIFDTSETAFGASRTASWVSPGGLLGMGMEDNRQTSKTSQYARPGKGNPNRHHL